MARDSFPPQCDLICRGFRASHLTAPRFPLRKERILILHELQWHRALLVVVRHVVDPGAHRIAPHRTSIVGFQTFGDHRHVLHAGIEPQVVTITAENHWHSVVDGRGNRVWGRGQDGAGLSPLTSGILPSIPQPGKGKQLASADFETVRLFVPCCALPFVKAVGRDQASAESQRIAESRLGRRRLRLRVDRAHGDGRPFCPVRNEAPAHQRQFPDILLGVLANDRDRLGWRDVVAGNPVLFARNTAEVFLDDLLLSRESISTTHGEIMADRLAFPLGQQSGAQLAKSAQLRPSTGSESEALTAFSCGHHTSERACRTISTRTFLVSAGLFTSLKNAMRAPRIPPWVLKPT
jgi:hypothetical protein